MRDSRLLAHPASEFFQYEYQKFLAANTEAKSIGMSILRLFSSLIPVITLCTNLATLIILSLAVTLSYRVQ